MNMHIEIKKEVLIFSVILAAIFAALKIFGIIAWSWALITLPIWIWPAGIVALILIVKVGELIIDIYDQIMWDSIMKPNKPKRNKVKRKKETIKPQMQKTETVEKSYIQSKKPVQPDYLTQRRTATKTELDQYEYEQSQKPTTLERKR